MEDTSLKSIAISGPTLASLIQRFSFAAGDIDGIILGHVASILPSTLSDDHHPSSSHDSLSLVATITGFFSPNPSFYDSACRLRSSVLRRIAENRDHRASILGWFSGRRRTPLRPSMREFSVSFSLSTMGDFLTSFKFRPSIFILLSTPLTDQIIHTHEYRAYQYSLSSDSFNPKSINVVNLGPEFREHYSAFCASSRFPDLQCDFFGGSTSAMAEDGDAEMMNDKIRSQDEQGIEGSEMQNLSHLVNAEVANYTLGLEKLYEKNLEKLEGLTRLVENISAKVLEKKNPNKSIRSTKASFD